MKISSKSAQIETDLDTEYRHAAMSVYPCMNHCGISIAMLCGEFYLAKKHDAYHIVAIPSERWLQDLKDDGCEIMQSLNRNPVPVKT